MAWSIAAALRLALGSATVAAITAGGIVEATARAAAQRVALTGTPVENPRQVSAYRYPREYGPQSPTFARALLPPSPRVPLLLSGTASIDGKRVTDVPAFKSTALVAYAVPQVPGLKLDGTWQYSGKKAFDVENRVFVPDYHVFGTDNAEIAKAAQAAGVDAPFMRPESISGDRIGDYDVLWHALQATEAVDGRKYDIVVMLQPTSPLRTPAHVSATIRMLADGDWDSVWTLSATDSKAHPLKQLTVADGKLGYYDPDGGAIIARQQLKPVFHRNGIAYAMTRECLADQGSIMGRKAGALVIEGEKRALAIEDTAAGEWCATAERDARDNHADSRSWASP